MSAAPAPLHLLHPSGAPAPPPSAVVAGGARRPVTGRARRIFLRGWMTACTVILLAFLPPALRREPSIVIAVLAGMVMVPCGMGLGCVALLERTRESALALLAAALGMAAMVALLPVVFRVNTELWFAAHQAELDALAVEIRAAYAPVDPADREVSAQAIGPFSDRLWEAGVGSVRRTDGGLLFSTWPGGEVLLYADGVPHGEPECAVPRLRALGGRWFEWGCGPQWGWLN